MAVSDDVKVSITLTKEELYVILVTLGEPELPGFDLSWLQRTPDGKVIPEVKGALDAAINSLVARGFLGYITEEERKKQAEGMRPLRPLKEVHTIIGACGYSEANLFVSLNLEIGQYTSHFYRWKDLVIMQTMPFQDVYAFQVIESNEVVANTICDLLDLKQQEKELATFESTLDAAKGITARDLLRKGEWEKGIQELRAGGLGEQDAKLLGRGMADADNHGSIAIIVHGETPEERIVTAQALFVTPLYCFALTPTAHDQNILNVRATTAQGVKRWITAAFFHKTEVEKAGKKEEEKK